MLFFHLLNIVSGTQLEIHSAIGSLPQTNPVVQGMQQNVQTNSDEILLRNIKILNQLHNLNMQVPNANQNSKKLPLFINYKNKKLVGSNQVINNEKRPSNLTKEEEKIYNILDNSFEVAKNSSEKISATKFNKLYTLYSIEMLNECIKLRQKQNITEDFGFISFFLENFDDSYNVRPLRKTIKNFHCYKPFKNALKSVLNETHIQTTEDSLNNIQDMNYVWKKALEWDKEVNNKLTEVLKDENAFPHVNLTQIMTNSSNEINKFLTSVFNNYFYAEVVKNVNKENIENYYTTKLNDTSRKKVMYCLEEYIETLVSEFKKSISSLASVVKSSRCTIS